MADLSPHIQERVVCSITAAVKYEVLANIVLAVAEKEGGRAGQWVRNSNDTYDVGPMQFKTAYFSPTWPDTALPQAVEQAGCYAYDLAAWRLRMHIKNDKGDLWTKAANYRSATPHLNAAYRADLIRKAVKWTKWLDARFVTYEVTESSVKR